MTLKRRLTAGLRWVGAFLLFLILTACFIPDRLIRDYVVQALQQEGYTLQAARFGKAFPLGVQARGLEITGSDGLLVKAEKVNLQLRLFPLLTGKVVFGCDAVIGNGRISGEYGIRDGVSRIEIANLRLEDLPLIRTLTGAGVKGTLTVHGSFRGKGKGVTGDLKLEVKGANVAGLKISGVSLPDADYPEVQGVLRAGSGSITLTSFTLEGEGIYSRIKGDLPLVEPLGAAPLNLTIELMPKPEFLEKQKFVFLLLAKYLTTPGHYEIPLRGTLASPRIL
jgi:type II secretion system protein N